MRSIKTSIADRPSRTSLCSKMPRRSIQTGPGRLIMISLIDGSAINASIGPSPPPANVVDAGDEAANTRSSSLPQVNGFSRRWVSVSMNSPRLDKANHLIVDRLVIVNNDRRSRADRSRQSVSQVQ